jgi:hypothetical protein
MRETFSTFVRLRRRWFLALFFVIFPTSLLLIGWRYQSAVEMVAVALAVSLVATTVISLLSAPVVVLIARRRARGKGDTNAYLAGRGG